jgi:hypothetical protein
VKNISLKEGEELILTFQCEGKYKAENWQSEVFVRYTRLFLLVMTPGCEAKDITLREVCNTLEDNAKASYHAMNNPTATRRV